MRDSRAEASTGRSIGVEVAVWRRRRWEAFGCGMPVFRLVVKVGGTSGAIMDAQDRKILWRAFVISVCWQSISAWNTVSAAVGPLILCWALWPLPGWVIGLSPHRTQQGEGNMGKRLCFVWNWW